MQNVRKQRRLVSRRTASWRWASRWCSAVVAAASKPDRGAWTLVTCNVTHTDLLLLYYYYYYYYSISELSRLRKLRTTKERNYRTSMGTYMPTQLPFCDFFAIRRYTPTYTQNIYIHTWSCRVTPRRNRKTLKTLKLYNDNAWTSDCPSRLIMYSFVFSGGNYSRNYLCVLVFEIVHDWSSVGFTEYVIKIREKCTAMRGNSWFRLFENMAEVVHNTANL